VHIPESRELNTWADGREKCGIVTLAFENGLLMMGADGGVPVLAGHTPSYFSLTKLPYDYDPAAECRRWCEFLDDVMAGDVERIELLAQWAGYLLMPTTKQQKFLLIAGEGQNGKTVFSGILENMVGEAGFWLFVFILWCRDGQNPCKNGSSRVGIFLIFLL